MWTTFQLCLLTRNQGWRQVGRRKSVREELTEDRLVLAEAAEFGKENQEDAAGGLLKEIQVTNVETQTSQTEIQLLKHSFHSHPTTLLLAPNCLLCSSSIKAESSCRYIRITIEGE